MMLFCGIPSEPPLALAIAAAERRGVAYLVFNQRDAAHADIALDIIDGRMIGALWAWEREWPLANFSAVYSRMIEVEALPEARARGRTPPDPLALQRSVALHQTLNAWIEVMDGKVLNRARAMASNASKPFQAQIIRQVGFAVPETLVTNDADEALRFVALHGRVIYKSISSVRSIVREFSPAARTRLPHICHLPTQFQAFVPGTNIRVHVVGDAVFPTEILSDAVDYRYAARDDMEVSMRPLRLPSTIEERCRALSRRLDLPLCGIDLKRTPDGDYYCFEVNPCPAYSYYEEHTGQAIAAAVVDYMVGGNARQFGMACADH